MGLIDRIKSALGLGTAGGPATADAGAGSESEDVNVTVEHEPEHEPATASEDAVKGTDTSSASSTADRPDDSGEESDDGAPATGDREIDLQEIKGIGPTYAERLREAGVESVADLAAADAETLDEETDIGPNRLSNWIERARAR